MEHLGTRVAALRRQRGWTQEILAERAQIHRVYLAGLETGRRTNPQLEKVVRLADALGTTVDALLKGEEPTAA